MQDRATHKLFSIEIINGKDYPKIGQKTMNAASAKFVILWLHHIYQVMVETIVDDGSSLLLD